MARSLPGTCVQTVLNFHTNVLLFFSHFHADACIAFEDKSVTRSNCRLTGLRCKQVSRKQSLNDALSSKNTINSVYVTDE